MCSYVSALQPMGGYSSLTFCSAGDHDLSRFVLVEPRTFGGRAQHRQDYARLEQCFTERTGEPNRKNDEKPPTMANDVTVVTAAGAGWGHPDPVKAFLLLIGVFASLAAGALTQYARAADAAKA